MKQIVQIQLPDGTKVDFPEGCFIPQIGSVIAVNNIVGRVDDIRHEYVTGGNM